MTIVWGLVFLSVMLDYRLIVKIYYVKNENEKVGTGQKVTAFGKERRLVRLRDGISSCTSNQRAVEQRKMYHLLIWFLFAIPYCRKLASERVSMSEMGDICKSVVNMLVLLDKVSNMVVQLNRKPGSRKTCLYTHVALLLLYHYINSRQTSR